ncbi:MAG: DUF4124 domain-containing protein [Pseudomonadales bacterium]|nr:DUF4124 domain-containing protein [Pseudomonadales bacterium]NIX09600.1 DUF4124 domain-containing protein [Pseudomonadales bacterium]
MQLPATLKGIVFLGMCSIPGLLSSAQAAAGTTIYKTIDEDGNVVFTDTPPRADGPSETVTVSSPNSFDPAEAGTEGSTRQLWIVDPDAEDETPGEVYAALTITSPEEDENIRENAGNVTVTVKLEPPNLQPGHRIRLLLDGSPTGGTSTTGLFALTNVDRGTHSLKAEVVDEAGKLIYAGPASTFHLQRYSVLNAPVRPANPINN